MSDAQAHQVSLLRRARVALALAVLGLLLLAPTASATSPGEKIILRCAHLESLSGFSQRAYREALEDLSATSEEYSPCDEEIRRAQEAAAAREGAPGGSGGSGSTAAPLALVAAPAELSSLAKARKQGSGPVSEDGAVIHPGVVHANIASAFSTLPAPLLAVLALMLACALVLGGLQLRKRVRARRAS
jgi:hypothetical protein